ncbi:MAG TPA: hypothetical protein VH916_14530 [Dehalococcoidia bacterium]|jgi:hypothetical protein
MPDKFEREIDEILRKIDDFPRGPVPLHRRNGLARRFVAWQRKLAVRASRISVGQVMLAAMVLMVCSYLFRSAFRGIWQYGLLLGLILFFTAFVLSLRSGSARGREPYFRGHPRSYYQTPGTGPVDRLRAWWRRHRGQRD